MNYFLQFGEDEDDQDDYESGRRRKKLLSTIRKRMSIVKSKREEEEEEEDEESTRNDDDEQYGFLKRQLKKRQENKEKRKQQQQEKDRKEKPTRAKSKEQPLQETRRKSLLHRGMPRLSASRSLRMSTSRGTSRDLGEEEDDVAMPLPGHAHEGAPGSSELLANPVDEKEAAKNGKKRRFLKSLSSSKKSSKSANQASRTGKAKRKSSSSSTASRKSSKRRRSSNKGKLQSSDRSVDSPPSVASTESSIDNGGGKGGAAQHHAPRREQSTKRRSAFDPFGKFKNGDDDDAEGALDCASLNNQSIPWIIKTWIYFVTVVVPFTILYYCFSGITHSSTLHENPILRKVYFANMLFNGLGCTYRTGFWARQALDARGIHADTANGTTTPTTKSVDMYIAQPIPQSPRTVSKMVPKRNRSGNGKLGGFMSIHASTYAPRLRRSGGASLPGPSSDQFRPQLRGSTMAIRPPPGNGGAGSSQLSTVRSTIIAGDGGGGIGRSNGHHEQGRSRTAGDGSSSQTFKKSVWDVEHLIPLSKNKSSEPKRPPMNKHASILEIYEVHAIDEKVGLLQ